MNRRELLRGALLGLLSGAALRTRALGQVPAPRPDSTVGDPLYRPDLVQQRAVATAADNDPVVKALEHKLKCTCGCNLDIYVCRTTDFTCQYSPALHQEVVDLRAAGKDPEAVVAAFVAKYGEQILMAPPAEGFNLAGYLVPGVAVLLAGSVIGLVLLRRARDAAPEPRPALPADLPAPNPVDQETLRRALADVQD
jgi:cytochrome c-type biogenesis protein CcmH/NrfF